MATPGDVDWDDLAADAKEVLGWAAAADTDQSKGSRALLVGLARIEGGTGPLSDLLQHFGVHEADLFSALVNTVRVPLRPMVRSAAPLDAMPRLSAHASAALQSAAGYASRYGTGTVEATHLLAGILGQREGTAYQGLTELLGPENVKSLPEVCERWLSEPGRSLGHWLEEVSPRPTGPPDTSAPPFLVQLSSSSTGRGLGVRLSATTFVTSSAISDADVVRIPSIGALLQVSTRRVTGPLTVMSAQDPDLPFVEPVLRPPASGEACFVAVGADAARPVAVVAARVVTGPDDDPGWAFDMQAAVPTADTMSCDGSPVWGADGCLLGMVVASTSGDRLRAIGISQLADVLNAASQPGGTGSSGAPEDLADTGPSSSFDDIEVTPAPPDAAAASRPRPRRLGSLHGAGNDVVGHTDQLGFRPYVEAFARLITSEHTTPPLTIGIFGSWGVGKSFLLRNIARAVQAMPATQLPRVQVVEFNAWEYASMDAVWPALVRTIVVQMDKPVGDTRPARWRDWVRRRTARVAWNLRRQLRRLRSSVISAALVLVVLVVAAWLRNQTALAATAAGVVAALGVAGVLEAARNPVARWVTALFGEADYGRRLEVMEDVRADLQRLERRLHPGNDPSKPASERILVVIDDLDRCEPLKTVEVLQAVNLLLNASSFIVCLGIDTRIVTAAVAKYYEGLLGAAGASGYEYLDKIVQIPFRIPEPSRDELEAFLVQQLGNPTRQTTDRPGRGPDVPQSPAAGAQDQCVTPGSDQGQPFAAAGPPTGAAPAPSTEPSAVGPSGGTVHDPRSASGTPGQPVSEGIDGGHLPPDLPFTEDEVDAFTLFLDYVRPNPRHLKRLVNVYRLVRSLALAGEEPLITDRPEAVIRWLLLWAQWPCTAAAMTACHERWLDGRDVDALRPHGEDGATVLFQAVRPAVEKADLDGLDGDLDDLHRLLAVPGCGLSWEEIGRLSRFTVNFNPAAERRVILLDEPAEATPRVGPTVRVIDADDAAV